MFYGESGVSLRQCIGKREGSPLACLSTILSPCLGRPTPKVTSKNKAPALQGAATPLASDKHTSSCLLSRLDALVSWGSSIRIPGGCARLGSVEQMEIDVDS